MCIVGSITGNSNTVGGGLVYPRADLGKLQGFEKGGTNPVAMIDGKPFFGAKAYKDSKVRKQTGEGLKAVLLFVIAKCVNFTIPTGL